MKSFNTFIIEKADLSDKKKYDELIKELENINKDIKDSSNIKNVIAMLKKARDLKESFDDVVIREDVVRVVEEYNISELLGLLGDLGGNQRSGKDEYVIGRYASTTQAKKAMKRLVFKTDINKADLWVKGDTIYGTGMVYDQLSSIIGNGLKSKYERGM